MKTVDVMKTSGLTSWEQLANSTGHEVFSVTDTSTGSLVYVRSTTPPGKIIRERPDETEPEK